MQNTLKHAAEMRQNDCKGINCFGISGEDYSCPRRQKFRVIGLPNSSLPRKTRWLRACFAASHERSFSFHCFRHATFTNHYTYTFSIM